MTLLKKISVICESVTVINASLCHSLHNKDFSQEVIDLSMTTEFHRNDTGK